jgi:hypothetical protein
MLKWLQREKVMKKEFRELKKMLENEGFIMIKEGEHCIFNRNGKNVTITKNVRDPKRLFRKAMGQAEK